MGFSTSGAAAILFIGLLLAVGIAYPTLEAAHDRRATAIDDRDQRALDVRNTAIAVDAAVYDADAETLTLDVTNTGSTTLSVPETDLLIDGVYRTGYETAVSGDATRTLWQSGETLSMTVQLEPNADPERAKVVTQHGVAATITDVEVS
ncbi:archaellum stator protein ArlF [Natronobiforma cellulositropha]|uniref:flagellin n=1 Tax=Natronobiforma cellulositropha TaxID=1679076 RepID=UPI0021D58F43|nr:flagellin [Natronobiforma cellulositropha]